MTEDPSVPRTASAETDARRRDELASSTESPAPTVAAEVFGDNLRLAERYAEWLADAGTERGLIGPREVPRLWDRHILNSAVLQEVIPRGARVVDVGSGAGLPGIPLAICRPDLSVTLVEPLLRRATFLEEVVADLGLPVRVVRGRAEEKSVVSTIGGADVVTSRAVAPLGKLAKWSLPFVRVGGSLRALKGSSVRDEIARDRNDIKKARGGDATVHEVGLGVLESPTYVLEIPRVK
ncbi:16S rRNA (guanine(527)-N(7))-methyltransferase RsmG [Corynebacterium bovis]|nr:16S rRNA (guanine(527)-N(7))-methyltransferase RsmG [Corynebacterium bovis]MDK8511294.1 16S rRNA (guanine(527)-N(7))-methyltransferase RsmG [Corynebacterium bovis]